MYYGMEMGYPPVDRHIPVKTVPSIPNTSTGSMSFLGGQKRENVFEIKMSHLKSSVAILGMNIDKDGDKPFVMTLVSKSISCK